MGGERLDTIITTSIVAGAQAVGQLLADPGHERSFRETEAASSRFGPATLADIATEANDVPELFKRVFPR